MATEDQIAPLSPRIYKNTAGFIHYMLKIMQRGVTGKA